MSQDLLIRLKSTAKTGHMYFIRYNKKAALAKGKKNTKLEIKKFDPVVRKHVMYKESKK